MTGFRSSLKTDNGLSTPKRLDQILLSGKYVSSLKEARALILSGSVFIEDRVADKPGIQYPETIRPRIKYPCRYVSRGGFKLEGGLNAFNINPSGWICVDIGASSGGFTDCLLQAGARHVYAVDVAYGQLDWKLRTDPRVTVIERMNAKKLTPGQLKHQIDLAVYDTSFISLRKVIPPVLPLFSGTKRILALVKPQFELSRDQVGPGGIVTDPASGKQAVQSISAFGSTIGLETVGFVPAPIRGAKGNQEYLIYLRS